MNWIVIGGVHVGTLYRQNGWWHIGCNTDFRGKKYRYKKQALSAITKWWNE